MTELQRTTPAAGQLDGGAIQNGQDDYSTTEQKLCSGYGQWHSPNNEKNPQPFVTVTLTDIERLMTEPPSVAKDQAQWVIPSTLLSRVHAEQHNGGEYWALWADTDEPNGLTFAEMVERARKVIPGEFSGYTSRSATAEKQKARLIVPLANPVSGGEWLALQKILNDKLEAVGVTPDRVTQRTGQLCYLPNRGEFYQYHIEADTWKGVFCSSRWDDELAEEMERQAKEEQERRAKQKPERDYTASVDVPPGGVVPSEFIRSHYNTRELLESKGAVFVSETRFYAPDRNRDGFPGGIYDPDKNRFFTRVITESGV